MQSLPKTVRIGIAGVALDGLRLSWAVDGYTLWSGSPVRDTKRWNALMAEKTQNKPGKGTIRQSREGHQTVEVGVYVKTLSEEYRMLIILKHQLYGGVWEPMLDDLRNRLSGKPYIFKLANRIQDDVERIEQMRKFEQDHNVDLADYVEME